MRGTRAKALRKAGKRKPGRKHGGLVGISFTNHYASRRDRRTKGFQQK